MTTRATASSIELSRGPACTTLIEVAALGCGVCGRVSESRSGTRAHATECGRVCAAAGHRDVYLFCTCERGERPSHQTTHAEKLTHGIRGGTAPRRPVCVSPARDLTRAERFCHITTAVHAAVTRPGSCGVGSSPADRPHRSRPTHDPGRAARLHRAGPGAATPRPAPPGRPRHSERARARRAARPSARRASVYAPAPVCDATPGRRRAVSPRFELADRTVLLTLVVT